MIKEFAHPKALEILNDAIFWDGSNEFAPFGSDEGSDAFYIFQDWLKDHPEGEAWEYLQGMAISQKIPLIYLEQEDISELESGLKYILIEEFDWEVIAICFAQFILKGYISAQAKQIGVNVINRQMSAYVLQELIPVNGRKERNKLLKIQLAAMKKL